MADEVRTNDVTHSRYNAKVGSRAGDISMRQSTPFAILASIGVLAPAALGVPALKEREQAAAIRKATQDIQGSWYTVSIADRATMLGEDRDDIITYEGNKFFQKRNGQVHQAGTFEIVDATGDLKKIDYHITEGPQKGMHFRAIFRQAGDRLEGCCDHGENNRPTEFTGQAGFHRVARRSKE